MEERRQILLKIAKQLRTTSDFVEGIERSLRIMVGLNVLEPQIKAVLESLTQSQQVMGRLHEESLIPTAQEESQKETIKTENYNLKERIYKLIQENKQLKSQIDDTKTNDD